MMGKNDSCEPATKKLKQSQLCFKSPKNGNNNLKSKRSKDILSENSDKTIDISEVSEVTDCNFISKVCSPLLNTACLENDSSLVEGRDTVRIDETIKKDEPNFNNKTDSKKLSVSPFKNEPSLLENNSITPTSENLVPDEDARLLEARIQALPNSVKLDSTNVPVDDKSDEACTPMEIDISVNNDEKSPLTPKSSKIDGSKDTSLLSAKSVSSLTSDSEEDDDSDKATSSGSTPTTPKTPQIKRQMTPKMLKRHEELLKKKQLQHQQKEEKLALKRKMRDEKIRQKMEEEEKRKQLIEEKKKKRLAELELKNEEKRQKQEDKRLKKEKEEEEKLKKQQLKLEEQKKEERKKEEEERKKERTQAAFVSFFKKQAPSSPTCPVGHSTLVPNTSEKPAFFMPFPMKNDMRLAAICRRELEDESKQILDCALKDNGKLDTYLHSLKGGTYTPRSAPSTWPAPSSEEFHDCIIIEAQVDEASGQGDNEMNNQAKTSHRAKLLQFCENRRPAYFGTWTKTSTEISGRKPFTMDTHGGLDYEVDSDSDWEEEEEGEDLENLKDDEVEGKEEEVEDGENGYLLDNTFVPHGYLSDEEQPEDEEEQESLEQQKDRLVALKEEFDEEMKQGGAQAIKPRLLGCLWVSNSTTQVSKGSLYEVLLGHRAVWEESSGSIGVEGEPTPTESSPNSSQTPSTKKILPPFVMQEIARMVEGSRWSLSKLVREMGEVIALARPQNPVSGRTLTRTIKQLASKTFDSKENSVWTIKSEFRAEYNLQELEVNIPTEVTPEPRIKGKETLLDTFLKNQPPAKKRISLTPISDRKDNDKKLVSTPESKEIKPEVTITKKKKVAFVTLPPRTPTNNQHNVSIPRTPGPWTSADGQITIKPHVDTPRPLFNKFINKDKQETSSEVITISDDFV